MPKGVPNKRYTPEFKQKVVEAVLNEGLSYAMITQAVTYPTNSQPSIGKPKTNHSARTVLLPSALIEILKPCAEKKGYLCGGKQPWCYSRATRTWKSEFANLGLEGYCNYDFRTTYGTQLKEAGISSAIVADLMGHADTRMAETIYLRNTARRRDETTYECRINSWISKTIAIDTFCDNPDPQKTQSTQGKIKGRTSVAVIDFVIIRKSAENRS